MAAPKPRNLASAAAQGDIKSLNRLLDAGADVNERSKDGMTPLSIAAFWGYVDIAKILLEYRADVNAQNLGTKWTPLHCAAFQGHGPVVMALMQHNPDLTLRDMRGRTAADSASALDSVWSFFAVAGFHRTPKSELINLNIVHRVNYSDPAIPSGDVPHFSRPGSAYAMRSQMPTRHKDPNMEFAAITGDVLAATPEEPFMNSPKETELHLRIWEK